MPTLDLIFTYFGGVILALVFLYGTKNYRVTFIAGFVAFCVFYFSFGVKDFEWQINLIANHLKDAAIIYVISCVIGVVIYKLFPVKQTANTSQQ